MSVRPRHKQIGVVMVETMIILPFLLLLILAIVEVGRAFYQSDILTKQVRGATRYVATNAILGGIVDVTRTLPGHVDTIAVEAQNLAVYGNIAPAVGDDPVLVNFATANVTIEAHPTLPFHIRVSATYNYPPFIGASLPMFGYTEDIDLTMTFRASLTMVSMPGV